MNELTNQLSIEKAKNGFQVYLNDYRHNGTARPVPYVFETMDNLLEFIKEQLEKK